MKRFHVHVAVPNLTESIRFYSTMFGNEPTVVKSDYAKWMLDDPRVNFAISQRSTRSGINHLGLQVDSDDELQALHTRLRSAEANVTEEKDVSCCYARSDKYWVTDPAGVAWESFHNLGNVEFYDDKAEADKQSGCCSPSQQTRAEKSACCA
jgi:catechol 2,3-dioxygenase-like lactoylglutathione lyase family enzyme